MIVSATDLTSYLFCPRKLYGRKVLKIIEPTNKAMILGTVRHAVHDTIGKMQELLVRQISKETTDNEISELYKKNYLKALKKTILGHQNALQAVDLAPGDVFVDVWPFIQDEATIDAQTTRDLALSLKIYGEQLLDVMPKSISEYHVSSKALELKGIVDRIDIKDSQYIPYELKTGRSPREGVWPGHKIQVGVYELLLQEAFNQPVTEGYVRYLDIRSDRAVMMNPFLEEEVKKLVRDVQILLESDELPEPCDKKICTCEDIVVQQV